jgi:polysaccharide deacetylase family protein (PEP-CTERM system associated)
MPRVMPEPSTPPPALPAGLSLERCALSDPPAGSPRCAFTVDVEDWYQSSVDYDAPISDRVVRNCDRLLEVLAQAGVRATMFVQGRVAETFPSLVGTFLKAGHEVQSHGYSHRPLHAMDRAGLRRELEYARKTVEDAGGCRVTSFRAQDFSILAGNLWALEMLAEAGFRVDSSIFPIRMKRYGIAGWEAAPHRVRFAGGGTLLEVPVATLSWGGRRYPVAGGGYFRLLPLAVIRRALRGVLESPQPVIVYCHPYEFNPVEMAEYRGRIPLLRRLHQGLGRGAFVARVERLVRAFPFGRFDAVLEAWGVK